MSASLRISLLGGFAAAAGEAGVTEGAWRLRKAKSLVKLLALAPEHRLHRERASELLWPDRDAAAAANNLHQALFVARRALETAGLDGAAAIELRDDALLLGAVTVDVEDFETAAAGARGSANAPLLQAAVGLYAGELLPEDRYEEWCSVRRESLREQCIALLLELSALEAEAGDGSAAVRWLQRALGEDPLHEEAHRRLMTLFALSGRRQQALAQYQRLRQALRREFEDVPDAETRQLYQSILSGSFSGPEEGERGPDDEQERAPRASQAAGARHNLPLRLTSFVGRRRELGEVWRLLDRSRLVTLTGPGGCGKTRLALEAASGRLRGFPDGVWLIDLAPIADQSLIPDAVAQVLGVQLRAGQPPATALAVQLAARKMLIVLDNCEHLIDSCARVALELVRSCPELTVLATSREPLHVPGELAWRVPSLSLPEPSDGLTAEELLRCEAGRLFCERAAESAPGFEPGGENTRAIAEICVRLDGMPLALELAAARARLLSPRQIAERLGDSLTLLAAGSRTALTRQQTLRATLAWSHELLTQEERVLFRRLAVFSGSFALDSAEGICSSGDLDELQVLDLLDRLVDKSLVTVDHHAGEARYRLLETVRQYARERLEEAGERGELERRHLDWFAAFALERVPPLGQAATGGIPPRLDAEHDNLRAALAAALREHPDIALRLAVTLWPWWLARSHFAEGARMLEAALAASPNQGALRADGLLALVALHVRLGDAPLYLDRGEEAVVIRRNLGDRRLAAQALLQMGHYLYSMDPDASQSHFDEALVIATSSGDRFLTAALAHAQALLDCARSRYADADPLLTQAAELLEHIEGEQGDAFPATTLGLAVHEESGSRPRLFFEETLLLFRPVPARLALGYVLCNHAAAHRYMADPTAARAKLDRALALFRESGDAPGIGLALNQLGNLGRTSGEHALAREWLEEALALRRELGDRRGIGLTLGNLGLVAAAAGDLDTGRRLLGESHDLFEHTDDGPGQGGALLNLANLELSVDNLEEARALLEQSLPFWERQRLARACSWISLMLADTLDELDEPDEAARRRESARELFELIGDSTGLERIKRPLRAG
jgi:predicted ATPase/DNA-binding SARP family transcriptional activator